MKDGLYEELINAFLRKELNLKNESSHIKENLIDKYESPEILSKYLSRHIQQAFSSFSGKEALDQQIDLCNKIIELLRSEQNESDYDDLTINPGNPKMLNAVFSKGNFLHTKPDKFIKEITPVSGLRHAELFTGSHSGISLESEIKKEIKSSDRVHFIVSFIKWSGIRILADELIEFTKNGGELKIITTSYMGATDAKAVEFLSGLPNTQIKVSYNTKNERLHAKAYLFLRNTGFHTAYIGSSNISRSALTHGLEWNIKVTTRDGEIIIEKFRKTFDTYWEDREFEVFDKNKDLQVLKTALKNEHRQSENSNEFYFDLKPYPFQKEILEKLQTEREIHDHHKNLIVAATGTGKTMISAFDFKRYKEKNPGARLLFAAHREEILRQAMHTFRGVLRDNNFGDLWLNGYVPEQYENIFVSVPTLNNHLSRINLSSDFYSYIVIDEVHHIAAQSYRPLINYFNPEILLGLTATPERNDNEDILSDFSDKIAAEIRLPEAMNRKLLCPFQYFGVSDEVDLSHVSWQKGRYIVNELEQLYTRNEKRLADIIKNIRKYLNDDKDVRALGFCVSQEHAKFMCEKFNQLGYHADYLVSQNTKDRDVVKNKLLSKEINYLFVVDIFNEGVDLPEIDTVLFLRPTESLTVFLQQLGRGLRLAEGKDCLTVLDFVGNARPEYDFEGKFRALIGKSGKPVKDEVEKNFPHLPLGCSIILERKAKDYILDNITNATRRNKNQLINKIRNFQYQTTLELNLKNFIFFYNLPLEMIYKKACWSGLCNQAGLLDNYTNRFEKEFSAAVLRWLNCSSISYFRFIRYLAENDFEQKPELLSVEEQKMCLMFHYDVWGKKNNFSCLNDSIRALGQNKYLVQEIINVMDLLIDRTDHIEYDILFPYRQPLKLHSRYTRSQILSAFELQSFNKASSNREGVAENRNLNTELLFIDLYKSENDFAPTTLYNDFAIDERLFHWQSQNSARPDRGKGLSYINQKKNGKIILLFIRERKEDLYNNTQGYVFAGKARFKSSHGAKPMNIIWELEDPLPPFLWQASAKLAVG